MAYQTRIAVDTSKDVQTTAGTVSAIAAYTLSLHDALPI